MRRRLTLLLILICIPLCAAAAAFGWTELPDAVRPGKTVRLAFTSGGGTAQVTVSRGGETCVLREALTARDGETAFFWDGCVDGEPLLPGAYTLAVTVGGKTDREEITVGEEAPMILSVEADEFVSQDWSAVVEVSMAGTLTVTLAEEDALLLSVPVEAGAAEIPWDGTVNGRPLRTGDWELHFRLTDDTGFVSGVESINVFTSTPSVATDLVYHTPNEWSDRVCDHDPCFWKLPMGDMNEAAIWDVLTSPVTVLRGEQRKMIKVRREPSADCTDYVGEVTCASQSVHVLETRGEWTLIEAYSSSASGSVVAVWSDYMRGWVKTELLEEKQVGTKYGIVVDKLQQRLYIFKEGKWFSTLMVSTGFPTKEDPFNETPAGEYIIVSWMGGFWSEKLYCDMGLRINGGILLHEVPCTITVKEDGEEERNYKRCEPVLGEKASHGCIRIQRQMSPEGTSMRWLWNNLERGGKTKVIIWDDVGRVLGYPDGELPLYYNPDGGANYHSVPDCPLVAQRYLPLTAFTYNELEDSPFDRLKRCPGCAPQLRMEEIDELNEDHRSSY